MRTACFDMQPYSDLTAAYPNLSKTTAQVSSNIMKRLRGELSPETQNAIQDASARFGITSGMPGAPIASYRTARDLGRATEDIQRAGGEDFLNTINTYSGNLAPGARDIAQTGQFTANLGFQQGEARRAYDLNRNSADLNAAKFNEQFGPKLYETSYRKPGDNLWTTEPGGYWASSRGETVASSKGPSSLMFKYKY